VASRKRPPLANPPSKAGTVLFHDDFSNPSSGWVAWETDYGEFAYVDGELRVLLHKPDFNTYSILPGHKFDDMSVEVDARLVAGPANGVFGILCRVAADEGTASKAYVFAIRSYGRHRLTLRQMFLSKYSGQIYSVMRSWPPPDQLIRKQKKRNVFSLFPAFLFS
jgi:hypothetical protein